MIRLAYLVSHFPKLSETFVYREVLELRRQGAEVICFSIHRPLPEPLPPEAQRLLVETTYLWPPRVLKFMAAVLKCAASRPRKFFATLALFWRQAPQTVSGKKRFLLHFFEGASVAALCMQKRIAYLHAHFANGPSSVALAASELAGIPFGFTCHAQDIYADPLMLDLKIEKAALALTISACNQNYIVERFALARPQRLRVHRVAVDLSQFRPQPLVKKNGETPLILAIGRLVPKKGFIYLIRACEILAHRGLDFRCWIVGGGPEEADLKVAVRARGLQDNVALLGAQTEVTQFLRQADLFVMPCIVDGSGDRDGIPTTLMEAMAMQVPVISTNLSGIPELIQHEHNGLLVPPADPEALALAMCRLLIDGELCRRLAAEGRKFIEGHHHLATNTRRLLNDISETTNTRMQQDGHYARNLRDHIAGAQRSEVHSANNSIGPTANLPALGVDHR